MILNHNFIFEELKFRILLFIKTQDMFTFNQKCFTLTIFGDVSFSYGDLEDKTKMTCV